MLHDLFLYFAHIAQELQNIQTNFANMDIDETNFSYAVLFYANLNLFLNFSGVKLHGRCSLLFELCERVLKETFY